MTTKVFTHTQGLEPKLSRDHSFSSEKVLDLMHEQLAVLKQMTVSYVFIPEGSRIRPVDLDSRPEKAQNAPYDSYSRDQVYARAMSAIQEITQEYAGAWSFDALAQRICEKLGLPPVEGEKL